MGEPELQAEKISVDKKEIKLSRISVAAIDLRDGQR